MATKKLLDENSLKAVKTYVDSNYLGKSEKAADSDKLDGHDSSYFQTALTTQTSYTSKGSATKVPQITTNSLGQVTGITEVTITQPTVNNATLTIQKNGTTVNTFTANASSNVTANIEVPTKLNDLNEKYASYLSEPTNAYNTPTLTYRPFIYDTAGNRMYGINYKRVIVEESIDAGQTWTVRSLTEVQKNQLFDNSNGGGQAFPKVNGQHSCSAMLRVTVAAAHFGSAADDATDANKLALWTSENYESSSFYCNCDRFYVYVGGPNYCDCWIQTAPAPSSGTAPVFTNQLKIDLARGWNGGNTASATYAFVLGGNKTQAPIIRFVFRVNSSDGQYDDSKLNQSSSNLNIMSIRLLGQTIWGASNSMMRFNTPYLGISGYPFLFDWYGTLRPSSYAEYNLGSSDRRWNQVHAVTIYENGSSLSNKYLGKTAKASDSDKLDGNDSSYFYPASNPNGYTTNTGTVTSVTIKAGTGLSSSSTAAITTSGERTISIASGYKLPTTAEWNKVVTTDTDQTITGKKTFHYNWSEDHDRWIYLDARSGVGVEYQNGDDCNSLLDENSLTFTDNIASKVLKISGANDNISRTVGGTTYNYSFPNTSGTLALTSQLPTVNNGTLSIQGNGTTASEFTANQSGNTTLNIKGSGGTTVTKSAANEITISTGTIPTVSDATITIKQTGINDQTFTLNGSATTITLADTNTWRPVGTGATDAAAGNHAHGNINNAGTITSTAVTSATGVLVYDSNNKIQRATAANARSIIGAGTYSKPSGGIPSTDLAESYYLASNPNGYTSVSETTVSGWGFTKNAGTVIGSGLNAGYIVAGDGTTNIKITSYKPGSSSVTWSDSSDVYLPTMKSVKTYVEGKGYTTNTGTITGVSVNGTSVATAGVANITSIPYSILTETPTIPATNVIPAQTTANKVLLSTTTSGTAVWSSWSTAGLLKTNTSGVVSVDTSSYVTGSSLTSGYFAVGNGSSKVKISTMKPTTSSTSWSDSSDVNVPTMKSISAYVTNSLTNVATSTPLYKHTFGDASHQFVFISTSGTAWTSTPDVYAHFTTAKDCLVGTFNGNNIVCVGSPSTTRVQYFTSYGTTLIPGYYDLGLSSISDTVTPFTQGVRGTALYRHNFTTNNMSFVITTTDGTAYSKLEDIYNAESEGKITSKFYVVNPTSSITLHMGILNISKSGTNLLFTCTSNITSTPSISNTTLAASTTITDTVTPL